MDGGKAKCMERRRCEDKNRLRKNSHVKARNAWNSDEEKFWENFDTFFASKYRTHILWYGMFVCTICRWIINFISRSSFACVVDYFFCIFCILTKFLFFRYKKVLKWLFIFYLCGYLRIWRFIVSILAAYIQRCLRKKIIMT